MTLAASRRLAWPVAVIMVVGFALFLRLYGINFGLPHLYYWDEPTVVQRAMRFGSGDLNPHFFYYPALYMYVIFVASGVNFLVGLALGHYQGVTDFATQFFIDPSSIYLTARATTALFGAGAVLITFFVGRQFFGRLAGLLGALFLAVSVVHSTHAHIAITDVPHGFLIIAAYLPLHGVLTRGRYRDYLTCGLLSGLGMATKYLAVLLVPALLVAHLFSPEPALPPHALAAHGQRARGAGRAVFSQKGLPGRWLRLGLDPRLWLGLAAVLGGFFVGSPYNLIELPAFLADFRQQAALSSGAGQGTSFGYLLLQILPGTLGWPLYLLALAGVGLLVWRRQAMGLVLLIFPLIYLLFMGRYPLAFARYVIPVEPMLALMAGYALAMAYGWLRRRTPRAAPAQLALAVAAVALIAQPAWVNMRWNALMAHEIDPRTLALRWAEQALPADAVVAIQSLHGRTFFNAPLVTDQRLAMIDGVIPQGGHFEAVRQVVLRALGAGPVFREVTFTYDYAALTAAGVRYVVISDQNWPDVVRGTAMSGSPELIFADDLRDRATVLARFAPASDLEQILPAGSTELLPLLPPELTVYALEHR